MVAKKLAKKKKSAKKEPWKSKDFFIKNFPETGCSFGMDKKNNVFVRFDDKVYNGVVVKITDFNLDTPRPNRVEFNYEIVDSPDNVELQEDDCHTENDTKFRKKLSSFVRELLSCAVKAATESE